MQISHSLVTGIPKILHGIFKLWINLQIRKISDSYLCSPYNFFCAARKDLWLGGPLVLFSSDISCFLKVLSVITTPLWNQYLVTHLYKNLYFEKHICVYFLELFAC